MGGVEAFDEDDVEGEALGLGARKAADTHDGRNMAFEDPAPFAQLRNDSFLVLAQSVEHLGRRLIVGLKAKVAEGKRHADAVRRGEHQSFLAGHGSSLNARRASASCSVNHSP
jgi:hypothetical protein